MGITDEFKGEGRVPKALRFGATVLEAKIEAGKVNKATADLLLNRLKECEAANEPEDLKIIGISQVIGVISSA